MEGAEVAVIPELNMVEVVVPADGAEVVTALEKRLVGAAVSADFAPPPRKLNWVGAPSPACFAPVVKLNWLVAAGFAAKSTFGAVAAAPKTKDLGASTGAGAGTEPKMPLLLAAGAVIGAAEVAPNNPTVDAVLVAVAVAGAADTPPKLPKRVAGRVVSAGFEKRLVVAVSAGLPNKAVVVVSAGFPKIVLLVVSADFANKLLAGAASAGFENKVFVAGTVSAGLPPKRNWVEVPAAGAAGKPLNIEAAALGAALVSLDSSCFPKKNGLFSVAAGAAAAGGTGKNPMDGAGAVDVVGKWKTGGGALDPTAADGLGANKDGADAEGAGGIADASAGANGAAGADRAWNGCCV